MTAFPLKENGLLVEPLFDLSGRQLCGRVDGFLPGIDALAVVVVAHGHHDEIAAAALADACHKMTSLSFDLGTVEAYFVSTTYRKRIGKAILNFEEK